MILSKAPLFTALMACTIGCGDPTATVSGVVKIDGKPISIAENVQGTVVFQPSTRQGPILNGSIENDGRFQLTVGTNPLVVPGVYLAAVSATELLPPTEGNPQPSGRRITPDKYAKSDESGLRFVIKPGENKIVIELESKQTDNETVDDGEIEASSLGSPTTDSKTEQTTNKTE